MLGSFGVLAQLRGVQKFVLLRIFVVINVAAYFLATGSYFDNDWANVATVLVVYAMESGFMLWLGFTRGVGFHRATQGAEVPVPLGKIGAGPRWYVSVLALSLLTSAAVTVIVTNMDDDGRLATFRAAIFLIVEAFVMGFALLQGLRFGWNAVIVAPDAAMPAQGGDMRRDALAPSRAVLPSTEDQSHTNKRAENIKRGRIALGSISVICAGLAIYFHLVAHEITKPDPGNDAATRAVAQVLGDATASPVNASQARVLDVPPPDDARVSDVFAKAAQVATETGTAQELEAFPFPVAAGTRSPDGYPIYLLECNVEANTCFGGEGQAYGTLVKTADQLTPIRNSDAMRYTCIQRICVDLASNYVGAISSTMQAYWDAHHRPVQGFPR